MKKSHRLEYGDFLLDSNFSYAYPSRILKLDSNDFQFLDEKELSNVMSMVGKVFQVYEIDEYEQAWVTKAAIDTDDEYESNSVGLSGFEIEVVGRTSEFVK